MSVTEVKGRQSNITTEYEGAVYVRRPVATVTVNEKVVKARAAVVSMLNAPLVLRVTALVELLLTYDAESTGQSEMLETTLAFVDVKLAPTYNE